MGRTSHVQSAENPTKTRRRVLLIAYYFPPREVIGAVRLEGLAKYLPRVGWNVKVLTTDHPIGPDPRYDVLDVPRHGMLRAFESAGSYTRAESHRQPNPLLSPLLKGISTMVKLLVCYPDAQRGWYRPAVKAAERVVAQGEYSAIISSSTPETAHLVAAKVKEKTGLPWIADFRDLWTQNHYRSGALWNIRRVFESRLERRTLSLADAIVTVSEPLADILRDFYPGKRIVAIPNGFDPDVAASQSARLTTKFTITYTGGLYDGRRDPAPLFRAIRRLLNEDKGRSDNLLIRFCGSDRQIVMSKAAACGVESVVNVIERVPREKALKLQRESQVLLVINWARPEEAGVYTGKLFEYLAAQRPILATGGPGGVIKSLLDETGAGVFARDEEELYQVLKGWMAEFERDGVVKFEGNPHLIERYSHAGMAKSFAELLDGQISMNLKG